MFSMCGGPCSGILGPPECSMIGPLVDHMTHAPEERLIIPRNTEASVLCVNFMNNNLPIQQEELEAMTKEGSMIQAYPQFYVEEACRCASSLA